MPDISRSTLNRWIVRQSPAPVFAIAWAIHSLLADDLTAGVPYPGRRVDHRRQWWIYFFEGGHFCAPTRDKLVDFLPLADRKSRQVDRYTYSGFVEIEEGDSVVEVGAYLGGFTMGAAEHAARVVAFEPDPVNHECLRRNTAWAENVTTRQWIIADTTGEMALNIGPDAIDSSIFKIDGRNDTRQEFVPSYTIEDAIAELSLDDIDLMKVDAEGAELDILEMIGDLPVQKISVNCKDERYPEVNIDAVTTILDRNGYQYRTRNSHVFARRPATPDGRS